MTTEQLLKNLQVPKGKIDVILDTDAYNEVDDQFAISYMLKSPEKLNVKALYAAPFFNSRSSGPANGMEKSYNEILKLLDLGKFDFDKELVFKGSTDYLPDENTPVISDAAKDLAERAAQYSPEKPLYVVAIGAITNVASALLLRPEIKDNIVIVWLGGNALHCCHNAEFNAMQDVAAARIVFGCGAPLVQLPCCGVVSAFTTTKYELEHWLGSKNELCTYLKDTVITEAESYAKGTAWSRVIWDVTAVGWLLNDDDCFMSWHLEHSPIPQYDNTWAFDKRRHFIAYVNEIHRDALFTDLFTKLIK